MHSAPKKQPTTRTGGPQPTGDLIPLLFWTVFWFLIFDVFLYGLHQIPQAVAAIGGGLAGVAAVAALLLERVKFPRPQRRSVWVYSAILGAMLTALLVIARPYIDAWTANPLMQAPAGSSGDVSALPTATTDGGAPLTLLLTQPAPDCNNPSGVIWIAPGGDTTAQTCASNGLVMSQATNVSYAEIDLAEVNGTSYSQSEFDVRTSLQFEAPSDLETSGVLEIQTPASQQVGGYFLSLSPSGHWEVQRFSSPYQYMTLASGQVVIDATQSLDLEIRVQQRQATFIINGHVVATIADPLTDGVVGLMVQKPHAVSSPVLFSNLSLYVRQP